MGLFNLIKAALGKFYGILVEIAEFRISNLKNFIAFTVICGILNFSVRVFILTKFSENFNILVLY
jgi:hypothetical protein